MNWSKNVKNQAITTYEDAKIAVSEYFKAPVTETDEEKAIRLATKESLESYIEQLENNKNLAKKEDDILVLPALQNDISSEKSSQYSDLSITEDDFYLIKPDDD